MLTCSREQPRVACTWVYAPRACPKCSPAVARLDNTRVRPPEVLGAPAGEEGHQAGCRESRAERSGLPEVPGSVQGSFVQVCSSVFSPWQWKSAASRVAVAEAPPSVHLRHLLLTPSPQEVLHSPHSPQEVHSAPPCTCHRGSTSRASRFVMAEIFSRV